MALTHEQELKKAIESARLPPRDLTVLRALFKRADWTTAIISRLTLNDSAWGTGSS